MGTEAEYRTKALHLAALVKTETNPSIRLDLQRLSASYLRLAAQARANSRNDIAYETPSTRQSQESRLSSDE